jgi:Ankyrin repeats (3 copies)
MIKSSLKELPRGSESLDQAYRGLVERIANQKTGFKELAWKVLLWITCAKRPLTVLEIRHALAVEKGDSRLDEDNLPDIRDMVPACAGIVTVDEESDIIRLVHYTAQEYLQTHLFLLNPRKDPIVLGCQRDNIDTADTLNNVAITITTSCLTYLSFDVFAEGYLTDEMLEIRLRQNPFFDYAARNWAYHIRDIQKSVLDHALEFLTDNPKASASSQVLFFSESEWRGGCQVPPRKFHGTHLVAYFGLSAIMAGLIGKKDLDARDTRGRTPLSYASEKGNEEIVKLLLDYNVDPNSTCADGWTPLARAVEGGNAAVVQLLLIKGVEADCNYRIVSEYNCVCVDLNWIG